MCTSVQNIHIPAQGILHRGEHISFNEVAGAITAAVDKHMENLQVLCGSLVDDNILATIERYRELAAEHGRLLRDSALCDYQDFPNARTASPLILEVTNKARGIYRDEIFGPVSFLIKGSDIENCLADATGNARDCGAITSHVYSTDERFFWTQLWRLITRPGLPLPATSWECQSTLRRRTRTTM